jgi:hypothetical protein
MSRRTRSILTLITLSVSTLASGCLDRELKELNPCLVSGVARKVAVTNVDFVDILFVVDNSGSMRQEQAALRDQFPKLINTLTMGEKSDGTRFPPVRDMHLGVVSTDMGLAGVPNNYPSCNTQRHVNGGDDGVLLHPGNTGPGCQMEYPPFLSYEQGAIDPEQLATDFGCIANLGTTGCGFEQQLESGLKALWPKHYTDAKGNTFEPDDNPILFLSTSDEGRFGHGDQPLNQGGNQGFLRNDAAIGASLVAIILVSDEEDCSSQDTSHFTYSNSPNNPLSKQGINLRCYYNKQNLYDIERYVTGYKSLRPSNEDLVIFGAIVGVPPKLVDADARKDVDFLSPESSSRDEYYDRILADDKMQERPVNTDNPTIANVEPSCSREDITGEPATAYPPIRIVQVAKAFGRNAIVQSICQDDFGPAMDAIIDVITVQLGAVCLPRSLVRQSDGKVGCNVIWELPKAGTAPDSTPTECDRSFLKEVTDGREPTNGRGGRNCIVDQLAVKRVGDRPEGDGWFYDDFTPERAAECRKDQPQRVSFSEAAKPPTGVTVKLECLNETQRLANTRLDIKEGQPEIGSPCTSLDDEGTPTPDDSLCMMELKTGEEDDSMFCHPEFNVCVKSCTGSSQCPGGWVCDRRPRSAELAGGKTYCTNPTCGAAE